jgi:hypothetical protein
MDLCTTEEKHYMRQMERIKAINQILEDKKV